MVCITPLIYYTNSMVVLSEREDHHISVRNMNVKITCSLSIFHTFLVNREIYTSLFLFIKTLAQCIFLMVPNIGNICTAKFKSVYNNSHFMILSISQYCYIEVSRLENLNSSSVSTFFF